MQYCFPTAYLAVGQWSPVVCGELANNTGAESADVARVLQCTETGHWVQVDGVAVTTLKYTTVNCISIVHTVQKNFLSECSCVSTYIMWISLNGYCIFLWLCYAMLVGRLSSFYKQRVNMTWAKLTMHYLKSKNIDGGPYNTSIRTK